MKKIKVVAIIALAALAGSCFAPIGDKPEGAEFHPELSQEEMSQYQNGSMGAATPSTGSQPSRGLETPDFHNDTHASATLSNASKSDSAAAQSLKKAAQDAVKEEPKKGPNMLLGALLVVFGLIAAYGIRIYLAKAIPDGPR